MVWKVPSRMTISSEVPSDRVAGGSPRQRSGGPRTAPIDVASRSATEALLELVDNAIDLRLPRDRAEPCRCLDLDLDGDRIHLGGWVSSALMDPLDRVSAGCL